MGGLIVKWQFTTQNDVSATPSVDATGGYVYFPDWSGNIYKLNAVTGATVWTRKLTDYGLSSAMMSRTMPIPLDQESRTIATLDATEAKRFSSGGFATKSAGLKENSLFRTGWRRP